MDSLKETQTAADPVTELKTALRRCTPETIEAALNFRETKDPEQVPTIVLGIIERFLEPEIRSELRSGGDEIHLFEDLGIDSLLMVEIIILVEDTLGVSIQNEELRDIRTVGDIKTYLDCKIRGLPMPRKPVVLTVEEIATTMPHEHPFLFVVEAEIRSDQASGRYPIQGDEFFLAGHFKDNPVFPASIMIEALGQLAVLFLLNSNPGDEGKSIDPGKIRFTSCDGVRCQKECRPGDLLDLNVKLKRVRYPLAVFEGSISSGGDRVAFVQEMSLAFDYLVEEREGIKL